MKTVVGSSKNREDARSAKRAGLGMRKAVSVAVPVVVAVLTGCATPPPSAPATPSAVDVSLQNSVGNVEKLMGELVLLERSRAGQPVKAAADALPKDDPLQKKASMVWLGDARVVLARIATLAGLDFAVSGKSPTALVVALDMHDRPLVNMLESVATQVGVNAKVVYDPSEKSIELRYK